MLIDPMEFLGDLLLVGLLSAMISFVAGWFRGLKAGEELAERNPYER